MTNTTEKKQQVEEMFDDIAPTYDRLNHLLSFEIDKLWRRRLVRMAETGNPHKILDVATGTGDLAIAMARRISGASITGVDISEKMLEVGRGKVAEKKLAGRIALNTGDAEALDFPDGEFDCVTVAFGVRNFGDIEAGLREMCRVTRSGGRCFVLEFSEPGGLFGLLYRVYFHKVLPWLGRMISKNKGAYTYLPRSVGEFPAPDAFSEMMRDAGFATVSKRRLTFGVAYIYGGIK
jgi:demethylmenaquinone methyltransferase/2-methoxy-6-polyprenyl-1,4-benzoquinol methylase